MKKILGICLALVLIVLVSCHRTIETKVINYDIAYTTSEVQETTHDLKVANCGNGIYVEVPTEFSKDTIKLKHTGKIIYYHISTGEKVSNKGYEVILE